jgi:hypothetical protein
MTLLDANFDELMTRVRYGRELQDASFEPVYYLIFPPSEILDVKGKMPAWTARLRNDGWDVHQFSMAAHVAAVLQAPSRVRELWLAADRRAPLGWEKTNQALANTLAGGALLARLQAKLESLRAQRSAILLITDLEALHPYLRIGSLEGQLAGGFCATTLIFYPGKRTGKTRLRFLNFYPEDGNYRSVHVGG